MTTKPTRAEPIEAWRAVRAPWAMEPGHLARLMVRLQDDPLAEPTQDEEIEAEVEARGPVAVLPFVGTVLQHPGLFEAMGPAVFTELWAEELDRLLADPSVRRIVVPIDSPGGISFGVQELSDKLFRARQVKPIIAVANSMAASAAYWIGTAATELHVTPGGEVGSVGVWTMHQDISEALEEMGVRITLIAAGEHKVEGNPFEPLDDDARAELERSVNEVHDQFVADVARNRGVSEEVVRNDFGRGRMLSATRAVEAGMADGVSTVEDVVLRALAELQAEGVQLRNHPGRSALEARTVEDAEVRAVSLEGGKGERLEGVALVYGSESRDLGGWREEFAEGAFAESLESDDVRVIWQHDPSRVFGRVRSGTARIWEGDGALRYRANPPDAQWARDAMESIRRGDVDQNSFRFIAHKERWERRSGRDVRVVTKATLVEVGPQTLPAYTDTSVAVASRAAWIEAGRPVDGAGTGGAPREVYERRAKLRERTL